MFRSADIKPTLPAIGYLQLSLTVLPYQGLPFCKGSENMYKWYMQF